MNNSSIFSWTIPRGLIISGLIIAIVLMMTRLPEITEILFILFAGILLGVFLDGLITILKEHTPLSHPWAVALVLILLGGMIVGTGWLIGLPLADEMNRLYERVGQGIDQVNRKIEKTSWVQPFMPKQFNVQTVLSNSGSVLSSITDFLSTSLGIVANIVIILFIGVYLAVNPEFYIQNGLRILPPEKRERANDVISALGRGLRWWMYGRLTTMAAVGILTAIGLLIIGTPLAMTLGIIAALLAFVPYIGPILSVIPAVLVALAEDPALVGPVLIVYLIVQTVESYLLTPLIQKKAVSVPPALLISVQVLLGVLIGSVGVMLATPLTVTIIVLIQLLYIEDVLGERVSIAGMH